MFNKKWLDKAIEYALENTIKPRGRTSISRMSAVFVYSNRDIICSGENKYKTHPKMFEWTKDHNKICLHAELDCLIRFLSCRDYTLAALEKCQVYVARVLRDGTPALAKPCNACMGALTYYGISEIYWTT